MNINAISNVQAISPEAVSAETKISNPIKNEKNIEHLKSLNAEEQAPESSDFLSINDTLKMTGELNELMDDLQTNLGFYIREDMEHQVVVEIKDRTTNELIRQIPSEEMLIIREKMLELSGLIFDQSV
jgi:flagellar protein FlaG